MIIFSDRFKKIGSPEHQIVTKQRNNVIHQQPPLSDTILHPDDDDLVADYEQHPQQNNNNGGAMINGDLNDFETSTQVGTKLPFFKRALPPLPKSNGHVESRINSQIDGAIANGINGGPPRCETPAQPTSDNSDEQVNEDTSMDFAASIEKVKDVSAVFINGFDYAELLIRKANLLNHRLLVQLTDGMIHAVM